MHFKLIVIFFLCLTLPINAALKNNTSNYNNHTAIGKPKSAASSTSWNAGLFIGLASVLAVGMIYGSKCYHVCRLYVSDRIERYYLGKYTMMHNDTISHI